MSRSGVLDESRLSIGVPGTQENWNTGALRSRRWDTKTPGHWDTGTPGHRDICTGHQDTETPGHRDTHRDTDCDTFGAKSTFSIPMSPLRLIDTDPRLLGGNKYNEAALLTRMLGLTAALAGCRGIACHQGFDLHEHGTPASYAPTSYLHGGRPGRRDSGKLGL